MKDKILNISKDEYLLLKGLIPLVIKDSKKNMNKSNEKALKVSIDVLTSFNEKLKNIKF